MRPRLVSAVFDLSAKSEYLAAIERVLDRARDAGVIRPEVTVDDVNAIVVITMTMLRRGRSEKGRRDLAPPCQRHATDRTPSARADSAWQSHEASKTPNSR